VSNSNAYFHSNLAQFNRLVLVTDNNPDATRNNLKSLQPEVEVQYVHQ